MNIPFYTISIRKTLSNYVNYNKLPNPTTGLDCPSFVKVILKVYMNSRDPIHSPILPS